MPQRIFKGAVLGFGLIGLLVPLLWAEEEPPPWNRLVLDLRSPDLHRRESASRALIDAGLASIPHVTPLLEGPDPVLALQARRILTALNGVSPEAEARILDVLAEAGREGFGLMAAAERIMELGPGAVQYALDLLRRDEGGLELTRQMYVQLSVRRDLSRLMIGDNYGDSAFESILGFGEEAIAPLTTIASDRTRSQSERLSALWLGGMIGGEERVREIATMLDDPDPTLRSEAALSLADAVSETTFAWIAQGLAAKDGVEAQALSSIAARRIPAQTLLRFLHEGDTEVGVFAARALGQTRLPEVVSSLALALEKPLPRVQGKAILRTLAEFEGEESRRLLVEAFAAIEDSELRLEALSSLRDRADRAQSMTVFVAGLFDREEAVRLIAADSLNALQSDKAIPALLQALRDPSRAVRSRAAVGLGRLAGPHERWNQVGNPAEFYEAWWVCRSMQAPQRDETWDWVSTSLDAARILAEVRNSILESFYPTPPRRLPSTRSLMAAAREGMGALFDRPGALVVEGPERALLWRVLMESPLRLPEELMRAAGAIPFRGPKEDLARLTNAAAEAMVEDLDDRYSHVLLSHDAKGRPLPEWSPGLLGESLRSNGFSLEERDGAWWVRFVLQGGAADRAGLVRGDQVVALDGTYVTELEAEDVQRATSESVTVSVLRDGWNRPYEFGLIPEESGEGALLSPWMLPGKIGYLKLRSFEEGASLQFERALRELEGEGLEAFVLDLRNNPGGAIAECIEILDQFVEGGRTLTVLDGPALGGEQVVESTDSPSDRKYPIAVLVNACSASAAEMFAGAIKALGRGVVVGETTFGKGIGQGTVEIDGFSSETWLGPTRSSYRLYLTELRYELPGGKSVHGIGVDPDLSVSRRHLRGRRFDEVMAVERHPAMVSFVEELSDQPQMALDIAEGRLEEPPGWEALKKALGTRLEDREIARVIRRHLRERLRERGASVRPDIHGDRVLRAALRKIGAEVSLELDASPEYREPHQPSMQGKPSKDRYSEEKSP